MSEQTMDADLRAFLKAKLGQRVQVLIAMIPTPQGMQGITEDGVLTEVFPSAIAIRTAKNGEQVFKWGAFDRIMFPSKIELAQSANGLLSAKQ